MFQMHDRNKIEQQKIKYPACEILGPPKLIHINRKVAKRSIQIAKIQPKLIRAILRTVCFFSGHKIIWREYFRSEHDLDSIGYCTRCQNYL
jgi:hypothetical protein